MNYTIAQIEDAILAALAPLAVGQGGIARTIASYEGQLDEAASGKGQSLAILPAILVAFASADYRPAGAPLVERSLRFVLLAGSANLKGESVRRREAYDLLDAARALLNFNPLGLDISPLAVERETMIVSAKTLTVLSADLRLSYLEDTTA